MHQLQLSTGEDATATLSPYWLSLKLQWAVKVLPEIVTFSSCEAGACCSASRCPSSLDFDVVSLENECHGSLRRDQ